MRVDRSRFRVLPRALDDEGDECIIILKARTANDVRRDSQSMLVGHAVDTLRTQQTPETDVRVGSI